MNIRAAPVRVAPPLVIALILAGWVALIAWGASPYSRFIEHTELTEPESHALWPYVGTFVLFVAAWTLMTAAMMLPTTLPLIRRFDTIASRHSDRSKLLVLLIAGYLLTWTAVGAVLHVVDLGVHLTVDQVAWLDDNAWSIAALTLAGAAAYQFSPLKYRCLSQCRSPLTFIASRWHGRDRRRDAFRIGLDHGLFCVGCCWTLMLVMFAFGLGNVAWMLALGAVMAIEKNVPWGRRLSTPIGLVLALAAVLVAIIALL